GCAFAGLCYAEFASMVPVAGSAYTYAYATLGELFAWIIGWDLVLEYAVASSTVAHGWSHYFLSFLNIFGITLPERWTSTPIDIDPATRLWMTTGSYCNLPAALVVLFITAVLVIGIRESAGFNAAMVILKVIVVLLVIGLGAAYVRPQNWHPFLPFGWHGVMQGASYVFFTSLGAVVGITSVLLVLLLSQARVLLAMARDGLIPREFFGAVHPRFRTPHKGTILTGVLVAIVAALFPLRILAELVNIGTLMAFVIVCAAGWVMRRTNPQLP